MLLPIIINSVAAQASDQIDQQMKPWSNLRGAAIEAGIGTGATAIANLALPRQANRQAILQHAAAHGQR